MRPNLLRSHVYPVEPGATPDIRSYMLLQGRDFHTNVSRSEVLARVGWSKEDRAGGGGSLHVVGSDRRLRNIKGVCTWSVSSLERRARLIGVHCPTEKAVGGYEHNETEC